VSTRLSGATTRCLLGAALLCSLLLTGCGRDSTTAGQTAWVDEEVSFVADGLTLYGTYRHRSGGAPGPAALLISESGVTDRNGDNNVAGPIGNMRQLAEFLSDRGVATLRYDKVGTGSTGLGPYKANPADVGSAVYADGAKAAVRFLAGRPGTDRISVYALGEGTIHAMTLAGDSSPGAPKIHSLGLLQPLGARYLDLITGRVSSDMAASVRSGTKTAQQADQVLAAWRAAVTQVRASGSAPATLPDGLSAILNPGNAKAVAEADAIDPLDLAAEVPDGTPVLLSCSDSDAQARCSGIAPLARALEHTALTLLELKGVNHVLRDDPTDNIANYANKAPLSAQLTDALAVFVTK
jgi:alpha-beta hydrolase superfamily lysophospholipase